LLLVLLVTTNAAAQTSISRPLNSFTPAEEVDLGREAASVVREKLDRIEDGEVTQYVQEMGRRLTKGLPSELSRPSFHYDLAVLDVRDVTSFTVPGGPVFVGRRMIELAESDDALAALLAHEIAHVALRHATAQVSAATYQIAEMTGRQIGLAASDPLPGALDRGALFSISSYFFRFDRAHEDEAHAVGAKMLSASGYDPDGLAHMVASLRTRGASEGGLAWLGRHPNARNLESTNAAPERSAALAAVQQRLRGMPVPERSIGNAARGNARIGTIGDHVLGPDGEYRSVTAGDSLQFAVPTNWTRMLSGNTVIFAPEGAFISTADRPTAFTHGLQIGVARSLTRELSGDAPALLTTIAQHNTRATWSPVFRAIRIAGRDAVTTTMNNVSPITGEFETVTLTALRLSDDSLLYVLGVAPQLDAGVYRGAFERIIQSLRILDE
jgi:beta-barrel assembly-enhancing protease